MMRYDISEVMNNQQKNIFGNKASSWANYSDLSRGHPPHCGLAREVSPPKKMP